MRGSGVGTRQVALVAAGVQAAAVVAVVLAGASSQPVQLDPWRPVASVVLYLVPPVLAVLGVRGRPWLLLPAAATSVVLAVIGFSLHSLVFLPVAAVYVVADRRIGQRPTTVRVAPLLLCPALVLVGALAVQFLHDDPACWTRDGSGEVIVDRNPGDITSGSRSIGADSDVVASGCTSDTVVAWEVAGGVALSGLAIATGLGSGRPRPPSHPRRLGSGVTHG